MQAGCKDSCGFSGPSISSSQSAFFGHFSVIFQSFFSLLGSVGYLRVLAVGYLQADSCSRHFSVIFQSSRVRVFKIGASGLIPAVGIFPSFFSLLGYSKSAARAGPHSTVLPAPGPSADIVVYMITQFVANIMKQCTTTLPAPVRSCQPSHP